ncbi:MAG TPA: DUF5691 domain-containing protein [Candidatus Limnocylindrales bacterium]|nr:DUF5691 domain-containing protein [Candidatus Limnocylindrales bacterium]
MLTLTPEQVRTLAPDASAARSGEALGSPRRWTGAGRNEGAAWGLCQGSGSNPYQVVVDLAGPAYKCSCPSRKIPCKHALGLLFLIADSGAPTAGPPDWVQTWLDSRASRAEAAATRAERATEADPEVRARRIATRERKVAAGIDELDRWLRDLMRRGLDSTRSEGYRFWDAMGARLVDAQAGGLGRSVRGLGSAANSGDAWPHLLLEGAGRLHLLAEAYRRHEQLPEDLRADVRALVGWNVKEDELDPANAVEDRWLVIGQRIDDRGDIVTARTYLLGEASGRIGLQLAFGVGAAPPTLLALPGQAFRASATFYPSATPLRVAVRVPIEPDGDVTSLPGAITLAAVVDEHGARLARNPFAGAWPVVIANVVPVVHGDRLLARDADGIALPIVSAEVAPRLLAISGGHPFTLVAEWDGAWLRPLAAFAGGRLAPVPADPETTEVRIDDPDWSALVSTALLGTERTGGNAPIPEPVAALVTGADTEGAILAAAGSMAVRRRAGRTTTLDETPLPPAAELDARPQLSGSAARYVGVAFEERPSLAPEILELVRRTGRRLPDEWLPELMALVARTDDADALVELGGPRAAWLAGMVPGLAGDTWWRTADDWDEGWAATPSGPARAGLLRRFRQEDLERARTSLAGWWSNVASEDRARVLAAIEVNLDPADQPFLDQALEDRRADVRRAAARLLVLIPDSGLTRRLEAAAQPLLSSGGRLRKSLKVALPNPSDQFEALGFTSRPAPGYGERAWLLRQLLAHVRPRRWTAWLNADVAALVDQAARSDEARPLLEGWIDATGRFGDREWAEALLRNTTVADKVTSSVGQVLDGLSPVERAQAVADAAGNLEASSLAALAATVPAPWPDPLSDAVLAAARALGREQYPAPPLYELIRVAALRLPPGRVDELEAAASFKGELRPALTDVVETIRLRARIHEAFA